MTRESHVARGNHFTKNKTIMCHIIINKTQASPSTSKVNIDTHAQCRVIICLFFFFCRPAAACMAFVWFSQEQYWGKPWMNYCTFSTLQFFYLGFLKDCQHHESISLYNVHNYRALVQHWRVERRPFSVSSFFFFFDFGYSFYFLSFKKQIHILPAGACCFLFISLSGRWTQTCSLSANDLPECNIGINVKRCKYRKIR